MKRLDEILTRREALTNFFDWARIQGRRTTLEDIEKYVQVLRRKDQQETCLPPGTFGPSKILVPPPVKFDSSGVARLKENPQGRGDQGGSR